MENFAAFAMGQSSRNKTRMVFDWKEAARRIRASGAQSAGAGLRSDWEWTGGSILEDGKPLSSDESYTYLASTWAVPELRVGDDVEPCYVMDTPETNPEGWSSDSRWPESALRILRGEIVE